MNRQLITQKVLNSVREGTKRGIGIDKKKLLGVLQIDFSMSERTAKEIIGSLLLSCKIREVEGILWLNDYPKTETDAKLKLS